MTNEQIISKYLSGNATEVEKSQLVKRLNDDAQFESDFNRYKEIWNAIEVPDLGEYNLESEWLDFKAFILGKEKGKTATLVYKSLAVAASIALVLVTFLWLSEDVVTPDEEPVAEVNSVVPLQMEQLIENEPEVYEFYTTDYDRTITLPDSTVVNLKVGSKLTYDEYFNEGNRHVSLQGAALFDVTRDTTCSFIIEANSTTTKVLGTSFLLRAYPAEDSVLIMVRSGEVEFGKPEGNLYKLKKGDFASYSKTKDSVEVAYKYIEETTNEPLPPEVKEKVETIEEDGGLSVTYDWKKNLVNLSQVQGEIVNSSKIKTFGNVRVKVTYFTDKKGKKASTYFMLNEAVLPGDTVEFKKTLMLDWFSKTSELEVEIDTAEIK